MEQFVVADLHFSHKGVCKFLDANGEKIRPWDDPDQMDEDLIANWNSTVSPNDKTYVLGDVAINRRGIKLVERLNGKKVLIKGNHDLFQLKEYLPYFYDIRGCDVKHNVVLSHMPIHPMCFEGRYIGNVHGHLHTNTVGDPRYLCVSVEQTNFRPVSFDTVLEYLAK